MTVDDSKNPIHLFGTGRTENFGVFVALAIGLFLIIQLIDGSEEFSLKWWIFSVVYFSLVAATLVSMITWGLNIFFQNQYIRKHYPELENELKEFTQKKWLFKTSYANYIKDSDDGRIHSTVRLYLIVISVFSVLLWIAVALDHSLHFEQFVWPILE